MQSTLESVFGVPVLQVIHRPKCLVFACKRFESRTIDIRELMSLLKVSYNLTLFFQNIDTHILVEVSDATAITPSSLITDEPIVRIGKDSHILYVASLPSNLLNFATIITEDGIAFLPSHQTDTVRIVLSYFEGSRCLTLTSNSQAKVERKACSTFRNDIELLRKE